MSAKPESNVRLAEIKQRTEFFGAGCVTQGLGLLMPVLGLLLGPLGFGVGVIVGLALLLVGSQAAIKYVCGKCGNPVAHKEVKICPTCKVALHYRPNYTAAILLLLILAALALIWLWRSGHLIAH